MNDWIIEIDMPIDQPWFYRTTAARVKDAVWAILTLGHKINSIREAS